MAAVGATMKTKIVILAFVIFHVKKVTAYYCEWDQCGSEQYCCGDNLCCDYVYSLWYFWVGIIFVILLISACGGLFRYCYYNTSESLSYVPVSTDDVKTHRLGDGGEQKEYSQYDLYVENEATPPKGPPPPYTPSSSSLKLGHHQKQFQDSSGFAHYL